MKLPVSWIKDYVDIPFTAEKLADLLTLSGNKVETVQIKDGEPVIEIEVTTNRPDTLSLIGLAREISALTGKKIRIPKIPASKNYQSPRFSVRVEDKKACPIYTAKLIEGVKIAPSPAIVTGRLDLVGSRAINNAVDVTNYVLFETGQPLHAFDFDKIKGGQIVVRRAKKGEKFLGLDGIEYTLDEKTLVIADAERPIAMAGVLGGKLTEITSSTKNILLEAAYFDPLVVRQAARRHKVSTDSSYRFERGVTLSGISFASERAAAMIITPALCGGQVRGENAVRSAKIESPKKVTLKISRIKESLGLDIRAPRAAAILKNLGFGVKASATTIVATAPDFRRDVSREADLLEEILRIEGFDKVKPSVPVTRHAHAHYGDGKAMKLLELKKYLAALGLNEIMTYSLLSAKTLEDTELTGRAHKIVNAVSGEQEFFRPSLLPGALSAVLFNANRKASSVLCFEIGNRYYESCEQTVLGLTFYGQADENWRRKTAADFFDLKGAVENILTHLKSSSFKWTDEKCAGGLEDQAMLRIGGEHAGIAGAVSRKILKKWGIEHPVYYAEIDLDAVFLKLAAPGKVRPVSKYPVVRRDIAFVVDRSVTVAALEAKMTESAAPYIKEARLFDQYAGKNIPPGKRSLAFSLWYHKDSGTFNEDEILELQKKVGQALTAGFGVEFRQ